MLNALFGGGQNSQTNAQQQQLKQQQETQKLLEKLREKARRESKDVASKIALYVSKVGYEKGCKMLKGMKEASKDGNGWKKEIYMEKSGDKIVLRETNTKNSQINTFSIDKQECVVEVKMENPLVGLSESATEHFVPNEKSNEIAVRDTPKEFNILNIAGFDIANRAKSSSGHLIVSKVRKGSVVSNFGMLEGTDLLQVDNMNTKQCTAEEIRSYIAKQAETNSTIAVYFMDENLKPKRIDVKLQ